MQIDPATLPERDAYKLLIGSVVPRPIAWVSSIGAEGQVNLAPFSYFTIASSSPPMLLFCPQRKTDGTPKDTTRNIRQTGEFVIHIVSEALVEPMNQSSAPYAYGESEFERAGLHAVAGARVRAPRIADAPVAFECRLEQIVPLGDPAAAEIIVGRVLLVHVRDDVYRDGYVLLDALQPVARLAGDGYARVSDTFSLARPRLDP